MDRRASCPLTDTEAAMRITANDVGEWLSGRAQASAFWVSKIAVAAPRPRTLGIDCAARVDGDLVRPQITAASPAPNPGFRRRLPLLTTPPSLAPIPSARCRLWTG